MPQSREGPEQLAVVGFVNDQQFFRRPTTFADQERAGQEWKIHRTLCIVRYSTA
jgi:hypothetical protein